MEISIDKRIELITIIQTLCGYWDNLAIKFIGNPLYQCKYKETIKEYFEKHKNHETVKLYTVLCNDVMDISAFINMALCYSSPPELNKIAGYENNFGKINSSTFPYEEFVNGLRKFYTDTEFEQFYKKNQNEYSNILNDYGNKTELSENTVFDYFGRSIENHNVIISPLVMGCYGIKIDTNRHEMLHYSVISPYDYRENRYIFGIKDFRKEYIWHEIIHLTINDLTKNYINQFNIKERKIPEIFVKQFYTNVETVMNEYIIRAITIRLFEMGGEKEYTEYLIENNIRKGFGEIELVKDYVKENCEEGNKFIKDNRYKNLIEYVINKI
jgi:hypothetical protein